MSMFLLVQLQQLLQFQILTDPLSYLYKLMIPSDNYSVDELNLVHDGTDVYFLEYGNISTNITGFGTFNAYVDGSNIDVDFIPSVGVGLTVNTSIIATSDNTGVAGTVYLNSAKLDSRFTSIPSDLNPGANTIASYSGAVEAGYHIVTVEDTTNNEYESFEVVTLQSVTTPSEFVEYANVRSGGSLGQVGIDTSGDKLNLVYTPNPSINVQVRVFTIGMEPATDNDRPDLINLNNLRIKGDEGTYIGTLLDLVTAFDLKHKGDRIFSRTFDGSDPGLFQQQIIV
jgi:hypothetical protein